MFLFLPVRLSSNTVLCPLVLQAFLISELFHNIRYVFFLSENMRGGGKKEKETRSRVSIDHSTAPPPLASTVIKEIIAEHIFNNYCSCGECHYGRS